VVLHGWPTRASLEDGSVHLSSSDSMKTPHAPVLLVGVDFGLPHFDSNLEELGLLAQSAGL
jgi:GTP-binding protein HflX